MKTTFNSNVSKLALALMVAGCAFSTMAQAAPAQSWNLSRDLIQNTGTMTFGTNNAWTVMYGSTGNSNQSSYAVFNNYVPTGFSGLPVHAWTKAGTQDLSVSIAQNNIPVTQGTFYAGLPMLHPTPTQDAIVRWTSPVSGPVNVLARLSDANGYCGDGVKWEIFKNNQLKKSGTIVNSWTEGNVEMGTMNVQVGDKLYFKVKAGSADHQCDSTYLDVLIAK